MNIISPTKGASPQTAASVAYYYDTLLKRLSVENPLFTPRRAKLIARRNREITRLEVRRIRTTESELFRRRLILQALDIVICQAQRRQPPAPALEGVKLLPAPPSPLLLCAVNPVPPKPLTQVEFCQVESEPEITLILPDQAPTLGYQVQAEKPFLRFERPRLRPHYTESPTYLSLSPAARAEADANIQRMNQELADLIGITFS